MFGSGLRGLKHSHHTHWILGRKSRTKISMGRHGRLSMTIHFEILLLMRDGNFLLRLLLLLNQKNRALLSLNLNLQLAAWAT